jgi:carbon monoxide dehydrogenase subunit G
VDVTGTAIMRAPPDRVWAALTDPAVLAVSIPGCERLERSGPDAYQFTIIAGIGLLQSSYAGRVAISGQDEPRSFVLTAAATGGAGTVRIRVRFGLAAAAGGSTELTYQADGQVAGLLAYAGQQVITGVARRMAGQFFRSVAARLQDGNGAASAGSQLGHTAEVVPSAGPELTQSGPG